MKRMRPKKLSNSLGNAIMCENKNLKPNSTLLVPPLQYRVPERQLGRKG